MSHVSPLEVRVLQGLRLKGFADASALATLVERPEADVVEQLEAAAAAGLAVHRDGALSGWTLTSEGRSRGERLLADEVDAFDLRGAVREAYERFLVLNGDMLATCTRWQVRRVDGEQVLNDHGDPAYDAAVIAELAAIDGRVRPICDELAGHLDRFRRYGPRFAAALERVRAGEHDWFTKPVIDSYHTVWFELHEDLLSTLGLDRAAEAVQR